MRCQVQLSAGERGACPSTIRGIKLLLLYLKQMMLGQRILPDALQALRGLGALVLEVLALRAAPDVHHPTTEVRDRVEFELNA